MDVFKVAQELNAVGKLDAVTTGAATTALAGGMLQCWTRGTVVVA